MTPQSTSATEADSNPTDSEASAEAAANQAWRKNAALFLTSQGLSLFGSALVQYAIMWHITLTTQSGVMMTIAILCGFLPTFLLSPFAGVWADRYNRKLLIMISDTSIALATLVLAFLFMAGFDALWLLFVVSGIRALGGGIQAPAVGAMLPQLVPANKLTRVNAIYGTIQSFVMLTAPIASAALLTMASLQSIFFVDVVTALLAVLILLSFVRVAPHEKAAGGQQLGYLEDFRQGLAYIKGQAYIRTFFLFAAAFMLFAAPVAFLTPLQVTRSFGQDVWRLTAIEIVFSVGMMAGGAIMASWGGFKNKVRTMGLAASVMGVCTLALGVVPSFWIYLVFMGLVGVAMPLFNTPSTVLLQHNVEENYLGRVFGVFSMIATSMMPLGMLVFGPIADVIAIEWLLIGSGIVLGLQGVLLARNKVLLASGEIVPGESDAGESESGASKEDGSGESGSGASGEDGSGESGAGNRRP